MAPNAAVVKQAELLRNDGNHYFKKARFGAAIDAYTEVFLLTSFDRFFRNISLLTNPFDFSSQR
jgi:hypothetical protein